MDFSANFWSNIVYSMSCVLVDVNKMQLFFIGTEGEVPLKCSVSESSPNLGL